MGRTLRNFENKPLTQNNDIVGVYNARKNSFEQFTDYYPYGMPHASISSEAAGAEVNRRKFGGKELMSDHGYNSYDFAARYLTTGFPVFSTPDPLAEKYKHLSPHLFCAGDPINNIDPTGMKWRNKETADELISALNSRIKDIENQISEIKKQPSTENTDEEEKKHQDTEINNLEKQKTNLEKAILDINKLANDPENIYDLLNINYNGEHNVVKNSGIVFIQYSDPSLIFHEIAHIRQSLESNNGLAFNEDNYLLSSSSTDGGKTKKEIEAYKIQYSVKNTSLPKSVGSIDDINSEYVANIWTKNKRPAYEFAIRYIETLKKIKTPKDQWP